MNQCKRCEKKTDNNNLCNSCCEVVAQQMIASGRARSLDDAMDLLWYDEVNCQCSSTSSGVFVN